MTTTITEFHNPPRKENHVVESECYGHPPRFRAFVLLYTVLAPSEVAGFGVLTDNQLRLR